MKVWVIVPVKRLAAAKSRLASVLSLRRRRELITALLARTLTTLKKTKGIEGVLVVGKDRAVREIARSHGAAFVREGQGGGLNRALARAQVAAVRRGAEAVMILPADLPLLSVKDIFWAKKKAGRPPFLAIAPDRLGRGTNLLLMAPPGLIRFSFGERSFTRHVQAAWQAGVKATILRRRGLAQDLDCPKDLYSVHDLGLDGHIPRKKTKGRKE